MSLASAVDGSPVAMRRVHADVSGIVQGVGFRPFVFRLAHSLALSGFVRNTSLGVEIEAEGLEASIDAFLSALQNDAPRHSRIREITVADVPLCGDASPFHVAPSRVSRSSTAAIPADLATCGSCLRELFDPADRRYRYAFITCTLCGPRYTIARALPYDRATTTMASFTMCRVCQAEYDDPMSRRFHAQTNACEQCGPRLSLRSCTGEAMAPAEDALRLAARALESGAVVAVKGIGGYHLACRADDPNAVTRLRAGKQRDDKPFAVMVRSLRRAAMLADIDAREARLLTSSARPIVLLRARSRLLTSQVAPGRRELGIMLPYTPLHHLLLAALDAPLVMTSGNRSNEPVVYRDDAAISTFASVADLVLTHDRAIHARCDDSVARVALVAGRAQTIFVRRARGFVPQPLPAPTGTMDRVLAVGGQLKNTICVVRDAQAVVGPHNGDLGDFDSFASWPAAVEHFTHLCGAAPALVAHDSHPDYSTTQYALTRAAFTPVAVQHHHAHLAACLAEHGHDGPAIGLIFDGAGLGPDQTIWGGEILLGDLATFERLGHLRAVRMPGGDLAVVEPWRMACAWLTDAHGDNDTPPICRSLEGSVPHARWRAISALSRASASPLTTSIGRLLDACAAICGVRARVSYEGQAAIELESIAERHGTDAYPIAVRDTTDGIVLDPREMVLQVERDANANDAPSAIAGRIHRGLAFAARNAARLAVTRTGSRTIVLSGGVFQNVFLLETLSASLAADGVRVLAPRTLPPNDAGLSYGQAVVALRQRSPHVSGDSRADR